jgi:hypothetical protein
MSKYCYLRLGSQSEIIAFARGQKYVIITDQGQNNDLEESHKKSPISWTTQCQVKFAVKNHIH